MSGRRRSLTGALLQSFRDVASVQLLVHRREGVDFVQMDLDQLGSFQLNGVRFPTTSARMTRSSIRTSYTLVTVRERGRFSLLGSRRQRCGLGRMRRSMNSTCLSENLTRSSRSSRQDRHVNDDVLLGVEPNLASVDDAEVT